MFAWNKPRRTFALLAVLAAVLLLGAQCLADGLPYLSPVLVLLGALVAWRYPGERALARLREQRFTASRAQRPRALTAAARAPRALMPRGGRLIAASLAVRPPPLARTAALS